jgi:hypothetical protein
VQSAGAGEGVGEYRRVSGSADSIVDPQCTVVGEADVENVVVVVPGVVGAVTVADCDGVAATGDGLSADRKS